MIDLHRTKRQLKKIMYSKVVVVLLGVVFVMAAHSVWQTYTRLHEVSTQHAQSLAELQALQDRQQELQRDINDLNTPEGMERQMREKFGVVKNGEQEVVIVNPPTNGTTTTSKPSSGGWWSSVLHFFHLQ